MPIPNIDNLDYPLPAYRGKRTVTVAADDITFDPPVTVQAASTGNLTYVDSAGNEQTESGLSAGDNIVGPGSGLVYVRTIRGSSTVTSVVIGIP